MSGPKSGPKMLLTTLVLFAAALPAVAQAGGEPARTSAEAAPASAGKAGKPKVVHSDAGKQALAGAKELATRTRGLRGPERAKALETAAGAYDKVAGDFANEPLLAAVAAFEAADLWRQQGSLPLAEQDYLRAARLDADRFAQRGLLGAADMQRRQKRIDDAMATYAKAAAVDPTTSRAQEARLWQARLLQGSERLDEAIVAFQAALESADSGNDTIEACNFLALAWVDKGDLDAAGHVIEHAEQAVAGSLAEEDPIVVERLKKALESMSAKKALQRARDKVNAAGKDADGLEAGRAK